MFAWDEGCDIAIWGTGFWGTRLYYKYRNRYQIVCFIDNFPRSSSFEGIPVTSSDEITKMNCKILIAVHDYKDICNQCVLAGKKFYSDFLPFKFFEFSEIPIIELYDLVREETEKFFDVLRNDKRPVLMVGNCQVQEIKKLLLQGGVPEEIVYISIPAVHLLTKHDIEVLGDCNFIFKKASYIITQHISIETGNILGTENIFKMKGEHTEVICIPSLWFDLYYPQSVRQYRKFDIGDGRGAFPYADAIIDDLVKKYWVDDIIEIAHSEDLFSPQFLDELYEYRITDLAEREDRCEIKMLDFLIENWRKQLIFFSVNHPAKFVLLEEANRLLRFLGYEYLKTEKIDNREMDFSQSIIYPSVRVNYGLAFEHNYYKDAGFDGKMDMDGYIKEYISYVHPWRAKEYFLKLGKSEADKC